MYRYRKVTGASEDTDSRLEDGMSELKDDFDYLMDTLDKLNRDGSREQAIQIMMSVKDSINNVISNAVTEVEQ